MKRVVILGAGTAGTMMAHKLSRALPAGQWSIAVVDQDNEHIYQPGLLFVPFGMYRAEEIVRPRAALLPPGVELLLSPMERVDPERKEVIFADGARLGYDLLIVATGTRVAPELTEGLTGEGWYRSAFDFYTLEGASALFGALEGFQGGRLVVNIAELPIKCPVAPLEFAFLADAWLQERGLRERTQIVYATPLEGAFTKPRASAALGDLLERRGIEVEKNFVVASVDGAQRTMRSYDGRALAYDLLVTVPLHQGSALIARSGLGDADGFLPTDKHTLQSKAFEDIFALGDATDLPTSKAGSVAHFQAEVLTENILRWIGRRPLAADFDGHANCFIETGHGKAILIDFNYDTEPLPGRFPLPGVGPFTLLEESKVNHWGKLGFRWVYWNMLLRGEELPLDHRMLMAGKWR
jgi:sulfide:quinone oxidoreductase